MSLYKRKDSEYWWIKLSVNGQRVQKSTRTTDRNLAQQYHARLENDLWQQSRLGLKPKYTWKEAVIRWLSETEHKSSRTTDIIRLRWLDSYLKDVLLADINRDLIDKIIQARLSENVKHSTINRSLALIRSILRKAAIEWEWIEKAPKIRLYPEPKKRIRWLTKEKAETLIAELPEHLKAMVQFSLETGLRQANVTGLQWSQIDLTRRLAWIHPDQAKARRAISVPLSKNAVVILREQTGKHETYVFSYRGKPITQVNTKAWHNALKRAGIENFRWHDLRHTWASWHVQAGTPLNVLQELGGWESFEMVRRYAHLSSEHLAVYVDRLSDIRSVNSELGSYDMATVNN